MAEQGADLGDPATWALTAQQWAYYEGGWRPKHEWGAGHGVLGARSTSVAPICLSIYPLPFF